MRGSTQRAQSGSDASNPRRRVRFSADKSRTARSEPPSPPPRPSSSKDETPWRTSRRLADAPGWLCSLLFHGALLVILALLTISPRIRERLPDILAVFNEREQAPAVEEFDTAVESFKLADETQLETLDAVDDATPPNVAFPVQEIVADEQLAPPLDDIMLAEAIPTIGSPSLAGRFGSAKADLIAREGGTPESEAAVALGLQWLANHQNRNGSWSFNHQNGSCHGRCSHAGTLGKCTTGATGLALLCFLGAGHSEVSGEYKHVVQQGVRYLIAQLKKNKRNRGNLMSSVSGRDHHGMYAQGIATLALCEAYNLGRQRYLRKHAQEAIDFIVAAQDSQGGGWRYRPGQPGDTSVVGWQVMALYSGRIAELNVPQETLDNAWAFLDSVQSDYGATYGYTRPGPKPSLSAVGLLSRMYLGKSHGWNPQHPVVQEGAARLAAIGPSPNDMYYNYYATQFMYQTGGETWKDWNDNLRDRLVAAQEHQGHATGSWRPTCPHGSAPGGRLYMTAMCVLTLEVYYRHLPIYARSGAAAGPDADPDAVQ